MTSQLKSMEDLMLNITQEIHVKASLERTFESLLDQLGPYNETPEGKSLQMKLEPWPGGRWYRDLGDSNGHFWATFRPSSGPRYSKSPARCLLLPHSFPTSNTACQKSRAELSSLSATVRSVCSPKINVKAFRLAGRTCCPASNRKPSPPSPDRPPSNRGGRHVPILSRKPDHARRRRYLHRRSDGTYCGQVSFKKQNQGNIQQLQTTEKIPRSRGAAAPLPCGKISRPITDFKPRKSLIAKGSI